MIGKRLENALGYAGRTEATVLLEEPEAFDAETIQEDEKAAKIEAECPRLGLTVFTDGSRLDSGAAGYAVTWQKGQHWVGIKTHMGCNQEAYDAECAALARALAEATRRPTTPERVTIFTDAHAAISRMASEEPGPGQKYAIHARMHIATLRRARPDIIIEIRWCPDHMGVPGNERADEWAKLAVEEPDAHGLEWLEGSPTDATPTVSRTSSGRSRRSGLRLAAGP
jgi:ribonuclease HI